MSEKEINFLETKVNCAIVFRADIETVRQVKKTLLGFPDVQMVYQRYSFNQLIVREKGELDDQQ